MAVRSVLGSWRARFLPPPARDLLVVLGCSWLVRALVIATWPRAAHSDDLTSWMTVARQLRLGANPYVTTTIVKWPPFAIVAVWLIDHLGRTLSISFFSAMRLMLIAAESAVVVVLYFLMTRFSPRYAVRRVLLAGISLNPIAILFVCQHENFDVFVGLFVALGVWALVVSKNTDDPVPWLAGCLAFGLGAFTKTVPLFLAPLLVPGFRAASRLGRTLGLALFLGPIVLTLSVVFVLAPHAVVDNVLLYRSIRGSFGVTGFLELAHLDGAGRVYERAFTIALVAAVALLVRVIWRRGLDARRTVLLAGVLLAAIPALGPGYGAQYVYWFLPPLLASYVMFDVGWRRILLACYAVAAVDWIIEYAFVNALGRFMVAFFDDSSFIVRVSGKLSTQGAVTIVRIPLFVAFLVLLVAGTRRLVDDASRSP